MSEVESVNMSDAEMDSLIDGTGESSEIPMSDDPASEPQAETKQAQAPQTYQLTVDGRQVTATLDQLQKWAQQGYGANNKIGELNQKLQDYETRYKPYSEIDQFAKENPQWWQHVQSQWENREQQQLHQNSDNPLLQELNQLKSELSEFKNWKNELTNKEMTQARQAEDQQLDTEIKSMRDQYSHLDWTAVDDNGYDLETRVLQYANENNIRKFDQAFRLYNHDRLLSLAEERGKESVAKDIQKKTKLGLLGKQAPKREISQATSLKSKTYDDLLREGAEELGISL